MSRLSDLKEWCATSGETKFLSFLKDYGMNYYFTMKSYSHRRKLNKLRKEIENENRTKYNNVKDTI